MYQRFENWYHTDLESRLAMHFRYYTSCNRYRWTKREGNDTRVQNKLSDIFIILNSSDALFTSIFDGLNCERVI